MKKKNILLIDLLLLVSLVFCPITNFADYPSGTLIYSDEVKQGKTFKWKVTTLEEQGESYLYYANYMHIGDIDLVQGDKIEVLIMKDPDEAGIGEIWYNVYVNDVNVTDPSDISLVFWIYGIYGHEMPFISPVDYTNATGTYGLYESLYEEIGDYGYSGEDHETYSYGDTTYMYDYVYSVGFTLEEDIFYSELYMYERNLVEGPGTDKDLEYLEATIKNSVDIDTGLLVESKFFIDYEYFERVSEVVIEEEIGYFHFLLELKGSLIPYNWSYNVLGLSFIALIVLLRRKKR
ncbi:MAG: hypothetical protein GPJ51_02090 [Candidatus Heimdallarchaeota archaeon]|nr:hypothetical protein [Candidatus Heimdallarchaeota archaeon]